MLFPETHLFCINCIKFFDFPCFMLIYMQEMPNPDYSIALFLYRFGKTNTFIKHITVIHTEIHIIVEYR